MHSLITFGGIDLGTLNDGPPGRMVAGYDPSTDAWNSTSVSRPMPTFLHHHGVVVIADHVYVIGGCVYNSSQPSSVGVATRDVKVFDVTDGRGVWHCAAAMQLCRSYLAVAVWKQSIFAVGGQDEKKRKLDSVECYECCTQKWTIITKMPGGPKICVAAAVLHNYLFVVGGFDDCRPVHRIACDVEQYDITTDSWSLLNPLAIPRCCAGLVNAGNRLYLVGGRTKHTSSGDPVSIRSIDEYEANNDCWKTAGELRLPRHDIGCCEADGKLIYIIGGMLSPNPFCTGAVECFDVTSGQLLDKIADHPFKACGIGCCSLRCIVCQRQEQQKDDKKKP